jgi:hypothetical protein
MKRAVSYSNARKRTRTTVLYKTVNPNKTGETKQKLTGLFRSVIPAYFTCTNIEGGAEYDKRIGNKIYLKNMRVHLAVRATSTYNLFRVMVVQSKQGMLAGTDGVTDSPGAHGLIDSNKYKLLWDKLYSSNVTGGAGTAISQPFVAINFNVKINSLLRYKQEPFTNFECDKPVYIWVMSITNDTATGPDIVSGSASLFYNDV